MILVRTLSTALLIQVLFVNPIHARTPDDPGWEIVSEPPVTVHYRPGSDLLASQVLERAATFLEETSMFLGLPLDGGYSIVIAGNRQEFIDLQPTSTVAPEWAGALTYPGLGLVLIMSPGVMSTGGERYWSLLRHEIVHLLIGSAELKARTRLPRWFQEGVATYISGEMTLSRLLHLGWAQVTGSVPSFDDLQISYPEKAALAEAAYARSFLFIRYLTRRFGTGAVARLVEESLAGGGLEKGAETAFGMPLADILEGFDQYARVKATWIPIVASSTSIWGIITLLFLLTWYRKRVLGLRTLAEWDLEEQLTQERSEKDDEETYTLH